MAIRQLLVPAAVLILIDDSVGVPRHRLAGGGTGRSLQRRVMPVSYTHLDVYKRQVLEDCR